jgi:hypothetical protein
MKAIVLSGTHGYVHRVMLVYPLSPERLVKLETDAANHNLRVAYLEVDEATFSADEVSKAIKETSW